MKILKIFNKIRLFLPGGVGDKPKVNTLPPPIPATEYEFKRPVAWLLGRQLIAGLKRIVLFAIFSNKLDPRDWMHPTVFRVRGDNTPSGGTIEPSDKPAVDPSNPNQEFWFDYIADSGDGQLAVFNVGMLCLNDLYAQDLTVGSSVEIKKANNNNLLPRGSFLMVGGDTAYHIADYPTLSTRFRNPFLWATGETVFGPNRRRPIFGIPGNHDYYDVIDGFNRQFRKPNSREDKRNYAGLRPQLSVPAFKRMQTASYVALRLPFDWWFWAVDTEIDGVDIRQQDFFKRLVKDGPKKLIIATSEPTTTFGRFAKPDDNTAKAFERLDLPRPFLRTEDQVAADKLPRDKCRLDISGDVHHYVRYGEPIADTNYASVVAGMGGAFLHPSETDAGEIKTERRFPDAHTSRKIFTKKLCNPWNIFRGGYVWLIGAIISAAICFTALSIPSTRAAVDTVLSEVVKITPERLKQSSRLAPGWIIKTTRPPYESYSAEPGATDRREFLNSVYLWLTMVLALAALAAALSYPSLVFKAARLVDIRNTDYWPVWVLNASAVGLMMFGLFKYGRGHSAASAVGDLVFITLIFVVPLLLTILALKVGAALSRISGKFLFPILGFLQGLTQVLLPLLLVRLGNWLTIAAVIVVWLLAALLGTLLSKHTKEKPGIDKKFGISLVVTWLVAIALTVGAAIYLPTRFPMCKLALVSEWYMVIPIALAAALGLVLSCVNLGWYFAISLAFNGHNNEAGGAARIESFKQMIRFRLTATELTAFVIGFEKPRLIKKNQNENDLNATIIDVFSIAPKNAGNQSS